MQALAEESYKAFGLRKDPFAPTADPGLFYLTVEFERCLYGLKKSIDSRYGIVLIFGNYGTGKTSLMRNLFFHISRREHLYNTAIISSPNPAWSSYSLLEAILEQFKVPFENQSSFSGRQSAFNNFIYENRNRINTLIIDDAQNLSKKDHIELLRLLQNLETPQHKLLNLVMFGQMDLVPAIKRQPNFEQRVNNAYILNPLNFDDMKEMIQFRLLKCGLSGEHELFEPGCFELIYEHSGGVPREVITICRNSLVLAKRIKKDMVQKGIVMYAINNLIPKGVLA